MILQNIADLCAGGFAAGVMQRSGRLIPKDHETRNQAVVRATGTRDTPGGLRVHGPLDALCGRAGALAAKGNHPFLAGR
jgi:hypothetical protein